MTRRFLVLMLSLATLVLACTTVRAKRSAPAEHRAAAVACPAKPDSSSLRPPRRDATGCKTNADCNDVKRGKNGRCVDASRRMIMNGCIYDACLADKDCGASGLCNCDASDGNYCSTGTCHVDADCGKDGYCSPSYPLCSLNGPARPSGWYCHGAKDECSSDSDCPPPKKESYGPMGTRCTFSPEVGHWKCTSEECPVG